VSVIRGQVSYRSTGYAYVWKTRLKAYPITRYRRPTSGHEYALIRPSSTPTCLSVTEGPTRLEIEVSARKGTRNTPEHSLKISEHTFAFSSTPLANRLANAGFSYFMTRNALYSRSGVPEIRVQDPTALSNTFEHLRYCSTHTRDAFAGREFDRPTK